MRSLIKGGVLVKSSVIDDYNTYMGGVDRSEEHRHECASESKNQHISQNVFRHDEYTTNFFQVCNRLTAVTHQHSNA